MGELKKIKGESYEITLVGWLPATNNQLERAREMVEKLDGLVIGDDAGMKKADELRTSLDTMQKEIESARAKEKAPVNDLANEIQSKYMPYITLLKDGVKKISQKIIARQSKIDAEVKMENARRAAIAAKVEQDRRDELERQAQAQWEKEAAARAEADRLTAAAENEKNSKKKAEMEAEAIRQQQAADRAALQAADREQKKEEVYVPPQQVMAPKLNLGSHTRAKWTAEIVDLDVFKNAILAGTIPLNAVEPNMEYIRGRAKTDTDTLKWPGIRFYNDIGLAKNHATTKKLLDF
jgi:hypothetical protein